jgi:hypothetical protein
MNEIEPSAVDVKGERDAAWVDRFQAWLDSELGVEAVGEEFALLRYVGEDQWFVTAVLEEVQQHMLQPRARAWQLTDTLQRVFRGRLAERFNRSEGGGR